MVLDRSQDLLVARNEDGHDSICSGRALNKCELVVLLPRQENRGEDDGQIRLSHLVELRTCGHATQEQDEDNQNDLMRSGELQQYGGERRRTGVVQSLSVA